MCVVCGITVKQEAVEFCSQSASKMASKEQVNCSKFHPIEDEGQQVGSSSCKVTSSPQMRGRERKQDYQAGGRNKMQRTLSSPQELQRFCEKSKHKIFQSYNGSHEAMEKVVVFIQLFDVAFMFKDYMESSKIQMVEMHLTKITCEWWMNLKSQVLHPKTWKLCRSTIWNHFLSKEAKSGVIFALIRL